jgi:opacity protein-like surface antigen
MKPTKKKAIIAAIALVILIAGPFLVPAMAADYLRFGLIHERSDDTTFLDRRCEPSGNAVAYFGCVDGDDGRPIGARGDFGNSSGLELAWGRDISAYWRGEVVLAYQGNFDFDGNANFINSGQVQPVSGSISQWRAGLNAYLDLAAAFGYDNLRVSPYVGLGLGVARNRIGTMTYAFPELGAQPALTTVPGTATTGMSWSAMLGTDIRLNDRNVLDVGLTWNDHGDVRTGVGDIQVIRAGNLLAEVEVGQTRADLQTWGLRIGLRHYFR